MALDLRTLLQGLVDQESMSSQQAPMPMEAPQQAPEETQGPDMVAEARPTHKGVFGIHGTARNILGILGDAFLSQAGGNPIYAPTRDREKMADALGGSQDFMSNPVAAIKKLNDAGYPDQAQELFKTYATLQATTQAKQSQAALDAARLENERAKGFGIIGSMASPRTLNEKTWDAMIPIIMAKAQRSGIADLIPPPPKSWAEGGQAWAEALQRQGIDPYKQERLGQIDEGLGVQHRNANTRERALNAQTILGGGRLIQSGMENTNRAMTPEEIAQFPGATSGTVTAGGKFNPHYPGGKSAKSFGSGGGAKTPSKPPRFANDHYRIGSQMFTSKDGKTWVPQ